MVTQSLNTYHKKTTLSLGQRVAKHKGMVMIQYEKEDNYPEKCYPVNCDFEKVNLNKKILVNENPFEPDFQTKLENQANLLPSTENHVIENFYTDYKCPPPSKLSTLKKWRTSLGQKTGNALAKTLQIVPSITNKFHNSISAGWHGIKHSVAKKSYHLFQGSKTIIKASAKPLAITVGIIAVVGVGYLVIEFFNNTILPSIQDATPRNLRKNVELLTVMSYLIGMGIGMKSAFKLKEHNENPTEVPISRAITMMVISALLLALPSILTANANATFSNPTSQQTVAHDAKNISPQK